MKIISCESIDSTNYEVQRCLFNSLVKFQDKIPVNKNISNRSKFFRKKNNLNQNELKTFLNDSSDFNSVEKLFLTSALDKNNPNFLVVADKQTAGYGTHNRKWESPNGNLYFSFDCYFENVQNIPYVISYALHKTISHFLSCDSLKKHLSVVIKWPNDILINSKKIAGILVEESFGTYIVGIGVNLLESPLLISTSFKDLINEDLIPNRREFITKFLEYFSENKILIEEKGFLHFKRMWKKLTHFGN